MITQKKIDDLAYEIIGGAIEVHKTIGPGLLESVYEKCLIHELTIRGLVLKSQMLVPVVYKGMEMHCDLRLDLLVEDQVIVELKSVQTLLPIFDAQLLTYMKLLGKPKGILLNFNCTNIVREGQKTFVNKHYEALL